MRIFILEDNAERIKWFRAQLGGQHELVITDDVRDAYQMLQEQDFDAIFLDHDLDDMHYSVGYTETAGTGTDAARFIATHDASPRATIVIHSCNAAGAARMRDILAYDSLVKRTIHLVPYTTLVRMVGLARWLGLQEEQC